MAPINHQEGRPMHSHFTHDHPLERAVCSQAGNTCSGCTTNIIAGREFYTCRACAYFLHSACFHMARSHQHPSEPGHVLNLLLMPSFECKACGLQGSGFCYSCRICVTNYHTLCLRMPLTESHASHNHLLKLEFYPPYGDFKGFCCDVCRGPGSNWLYRCNDCDFDVHLNCVYAAPNPQYQPQNLSNLGSQVPTGAANNYNVARSAASSAISPTANYVNRSLHMRSSGHSVDQSQALAMPANNISIPSLSARAPPSHTGTTYVNPGPPAAYGGYASNPAAPAQPAVVGMGVTTQINPNQAGLIGGPGISGAGFAGFMATGVVTGIGEGIGQETVQTAMGYFSSEG